MTFAKPKSTDYVSQDRVLHKSLPHEAQLEMLNIVRGKSATCGLAR
jgi:hypothetical protein